MARYVVAVTDYVFPNLEPEREALKGLDVELRSAQAQSAEEVAELVRGADAVLVCYAPLTAEAIAGLDHCRVISRYGIGVDNVDLDAATARGIPVTNVPDYCVDEVSDHALALLMALARKIVYTDRSVRAGEWEMQRAIPIHRLRGQTLGLLGFGKIPRALAPKAQALGLRVIATDPYVPAEVADAAGVQLVEFDTLLAQSDFLSIHAPLTEETRGLFNADAFRAMKPTAYIINTARGPLIDADALIEALQAGEIAGAGLDVVPVEPLPVDSPLRRMDQVILTPHTAFYSEESLRDLQTKAAEEVARALRGEPLRSVVNRQVLDRQPSSVESR